MFTPRREGATRIAARIAGSPHALALALVIAFCVCGVLTLPQYGLTWDEGLGNLFFGQRYCHFFATLDPAYLDFGNADLPIHQRHFNLVWSPYRGQPHHYPPFADTLSAATMELFAFRLPWLDPVDAFHLPKVLLSGLLLWGLFVFVRPRLGAGTALLSMALLAAHPRFWGDMHFNPKDIPETVFFSLTILVFLEWTCRPTWKRAIAVGALWGCALSIKANALFLPMLLLLAAVPWRRDPGIGPAMLGWARAHYRHVGLMVSTGLALHVLSWPYLYAQPSRIFQYYRFILWRARDDIGRSSWDALVQAVVTMPESVLLLCLLGMVLAVWHRRSPQGPTLRLLVVWALFPILRTSFPGAANFDGIRHFEEFLPAACILAAYASVHVAQFLSARKATKSILATVVLGLLLGGNLTFIHARYAPYQHLYFNSLVGGLSGAQREHAMPEATDYWASSYRTGMRWLNANAPNRAALHVPVAPWVTGLTAPLWLRSDIELIPAGAVQPAVQSERAVWVMFVTRAGFYTPIASYCAQKLVPVHQIVVDGLPVLQIYRLR